MLSSICSIFGPLPFSVGTAGQSIIEPGITNILHMSLCHQDGGQKDIPLPHGQGFCVSSACRQDHSGPLTRLASIGVLREHVEQASQWLSWLQTPCGTQNPVVCLAIKRHLTLSVPNVTAGPLVAMFAFDHT